MPCTKTSFYTKGDANKRIREISADTRHHRKPTRAYKCPDCGRWHLTSKTKIKPLIPLPAYNKGWARLLKVPNDAINNHTGED